MDQYKEFCRLRDYRAPGAEVCMHTEAEAFTLATTPLSMPVARVIKVAEMIEADKKNKSKKD